MILVYNYIITKGDGMNGACLNMRDLEFRPTQCCFMQKMSISYWIFWGPMFRQTRLVVSNDGLD